MAHISALRAVNGRLEANRAAVEEAEDVTDALAAESKSVGEELARLVGESHAIHARARMLGSSRVKEAVAKIPDAWTDSTSHQRSVVALDTAMRRDLGA
jgi:hypothetical protein